MRSIQLRAVLTAAAVFLLAPSFVFPDAAAATAGWVWPVSGSVITQYRNGPDPYAGGQHRGIDIAAPVGTQVVAAASGSVVYAGVAGSSGLTVAVRTADGRLETTYLHLSSISVRAGDVVSAGDRLGAVGTSGRRSAPEPHLHFGVREAVDRFGYHDPLDFLPVPPADPGLRVPAPVAVPVVSPAAPDAARASSGEAAPAVVPGGSVAAAPAAVTLAAASVHAAAVPAALSLGGTPHSAAAPHVAKPSPARASTPESRIHSPIASAAPPHSMAPLRAAAGHVAPTASPRLASMVAPGGASRSRRIPSGTSATPQTTLAQGSVGRPDARRPGDLDAGWLVACGGLVLAAVVLGRPKGPLAAARECRRLADSIASWATTSRRRSITSTRSRISATRTRRSRPTFSPATCASAARTSSS